MTILKRQLFSSTMGLRSPLAFFLHSLVLLLVSLSGQLPLAIAESSFYDADRVVQLAWRPRAFLYRGFLSEEECDHIIELAKRKMEKSMVADNASGKSIMSNVRTSYGMFLDKRQDDIIARIEHRIAAWTFLPEENAESMQVLRYQKGQKYDAHFDYFHDQSNIALGGHRFATVLMYLSDVRKGGETVFPNAEGTQEKDDTWTDCARTGYAVKPHKGDALLFFSLHTNATTDTASLHAACPVIEGEKWSAAKWIHIRSFDHPAKAESSGDGCSDQHDLCPHWAANGECEKNALYMVGNNAMTGNCRKSCGACDH